MPAPFALLLLFVLALIWILLCRVMSQVGGWAFLAARFRNQEPRPRQRRATSGDIGRIWYRRTLVVGWSERGLYLAVPPLWRPFHPALLIPWHAVRRQRVLGASELLEVEGVSIRLRLEVTKAFAPWLPEP